MKKTDALLAELLVAITEEREAIEADPELFNHGFGWHDRLTWAAAGERDRLRSELEERVVDNTTALWQRCGDIVEEMVSIEEEKKRVEPLKQDRHDMVRELYNVQKTLIDMNAAYQHAELKACAFDGSGSDASGLEKAAEKIEIQKELVAEKVIAHA